METSQPSARAVMNGKPVFIVPNKTVINFESGFKQKLLCTGPTFTAGSSCPYSCSFCYVEAQMNKQKPWLAAQGVTGEHMEIVVRRDDAVGVARRQLLSKPTAYRYQMLLKESVQQVIYASPLTDVAANMELVKETVEICQEILAKTDWHIRLLSKSNLLPHVAKRLEEVLGTTNSPKQRIIYGVSTGTLDNALAAAFEQGTPKVTKRIESLHWLQDNGYRTFGMICPVLPQEDYHDFARNMCAALRIEKLEHVWSEVINLRGESFTRTQDALVKAGYFNVQQMVKTVSADKVAWEQYARDTFLALANFIPATKYRFLQYATAANRAWWEEKQSIGAVLL